MLKTYSNAWTSSLNDLSTADKHPFSIFEAFSCFISLHPIKRQDSILALSTCGSLWYPFISSGDKLPPMASIFNKSGAEFRLIGVQICSAAICSKEDDLTSKSLTKCPLFARANKSEVLSSCTSFSVDKVV